MCWVCGLVRLYDLGAHWLFQNEDYQCQRVVGSLDILQQEVSSIVCVATVLLKFECRAVRNRTVSLCKEFFMRRCNVPVVAVGLLVAIVAGSSSKSAYSRPAYDKEFKALYVKPEGTPAEKALATEVGTAKCNVCHVGKEKKERNAYGKTIGEILGEKNIKDVEKIKASLEKAAGMPSDPADAASVKFGDLIKEGKLPGGPVQ